MADRDEPFRSLTGQSETADPQHLNENAAAGATSTTPTRAHSVASLAPTQQLRLSAGSSRHASPLSSRDTSPARAAPKRQHPAMAAPMRKPARSRKNSNNDGSPHRPANLAAAGTTPSAAAIQRALASTNPPQLQPTSPAESSKQLQHPPRLAADRDDRPRWPVSPRLKSPPPGDRSRRNSNSLLAQSRQKLESTNSAPNIVLRPPTAAGQHPQTRAELSMSDSDDQGALMVKGPGRASSTSAAPSLETVEEGSAPSSHGVEATLPQRTAKLKAASHDPMMATTDGARDQGLARESGSESGGNKTESGGNKTEDRGRRSDHKKTASTASASSSRPPTLPTRNSFTTLAPSKSRSVTEPHKNMTVETETVPSIPQATINVGPADRGVSGRQDGGSLRLKASNETIRPRKEMKRKTVRKAPSINAGTGGSPYSSNIPVHKQSTLRPHGPGRAHTASMASSASSVGEPRMPVNHLGYVTPRRLYSRTSDGSPVSSSNIFSSPFTNFSLRKASSKADIFEAKVASAVGEANSSDSDETFVYESNPPDPPQPLRSRHHSRTPSATSMASMAEVNSRVNLRSLNNMLENHHRQVAGKRSMKFAHSPYHPQNGDEDGGDSTSGTLRGLNRPSGSHHHHIGRHGRNTGGMGGLFDDSPYAQSAKAPRSTSGQVSRNGSLPSSPKFANFNHRVGHPSNRKMELSMYDMDGEGADDERTPLIGTVRTPRSVRTARRPNSASLRQLEHYERRQGGCVRRFAGCFVLTIMVLLLAFGAVGFLFATTKPLYDVRIDEIQNVLASEQEIMLDLRVQAVNPNIVAVTITDMDVNIFAKSKHVGTDAQWWRHHGDGRYLGPIRNGRYLGPIRTRERRDRQPAPLDAPVVTREHHWAGHDDDDEIFPPDKDIPEDPEGDAQTMLLGRIFHFDSSLNFEGDPLHRHVHYSVGEMRLQKPGNKTEAGGTERWERVIQYPFELIVRGILRYQLPLSSSTHTAPIGMSVIVHPEKGVTSSGVMVLEQPTWDAVELEELDDEELAYDAHE